MQEDKRWTALLAKERRLADHEWELYQKLGQAKTQEEDVLCQLDSMGTWFHDLSYDFEGSRYYSKITDYQLDFSHRSRTPTEQGRPAFPELPGGLQRRKV